MTELGSTSTIGVDLFGEEISGAPRSGEVPVRSEGGNVVSDTKRVPLWPPCCPKCSRGDVVHVIWAVRFNAAGDDLYECWNLSCSGYQAVYRSKTGWFEPHPQDSSDDWEPPLSWPRPPRPIAAPGPPVTEHPGPAISESESGRHDENWLPQEPARASTESRGSSSSPAAALPTHADSGPTPKGGAGRSRPRRTRHVRLTVEADPGSGRGITREGEEGGGTATDGATTDTRALHPPSITSAQRRALLALVRAGLRREAAVARAGVSWGVFSAWMARGAARECGRYHDFAMAVAQAEATSELRALTRLQRCRDPRIALRLLEQRFPQRWGNPTR